MRPARPLGAQRGAGGDAPARKGKPVEDALRHDHKRRRGAEPAKPKHRLGAGQCLEPGVRSASTARPTSQRTSPPEASGTTTMPANRSAPRSMNSPESLSRSAVKPADPRASRSPCPGE